MRGLDRGRDDGGPRTVPEAADPTKGSLDARFPGFSPLPRPHPLPQSVRCRRGQGCSARVTPLIRAVSRPVHRAPGGTLTFTERNPAAGAGFS